MGEEVFVVEAPLAEASAPPSPAVGVSKQLGEKNPGEEETTGVVFEGTSLQSDKAGVEKGRDTFPFA